MSGIAEQSLRDLISSASISPKMSTTANDGPFKDPSTIHFQSPNVRRLIILSYWAVVVLAIPLWWSTTSIQRLALPNVRVNVESQRTLEIPIRILLDQSITNKHNGAVDELQVLLEKKEWDGLFPTVAASNDEETRENVYSVTLGSSDAIHGRTLSVPSYDAQHIADALTARIPPSSVDHRVAEFARRYRLAFTLVNEDSTSPNSHTSWDIRSLIETHITPLTRALAPIHNFTFESHVQFHAPLAFDPIQTEDGEYALTREDLTVFINSAEWTLSSSSSSDPVLHFVLFVPSRPLGILDSPSNAFLLPQWGSVVISSSSPSSAEFTTFAKHLRILLGVGSDPDEWALDALFRRRALENSRAAKETLRNTVELVQNIEVMPVDHIVRGEVEGALNALEEVRLFIWLNSCYLFTLSVDACQYRTPPDSASLSNCYRPRKQSIFPSRHARHALFPS